MNIRLLAGNAIAAFSAQAVSLFASVAMSLVVPKILGVEEYGYWQLFIFYSGYSGFFHFGLNDGVYLVEGGKSRSEIDKRTINSQFITALALQIIVGMGIVFTAITVAPESGRLLVLVAFAVYTTIFNLQSFLGYVFQAMNETKLFSFASILERIFFLLSMLTLVLLRVNFFAPYVILYIISKLLSLLYCVWHARDILVSGRLALWRSIQLTIGSIKVGIGLMIANIAATLILGIARAMIDQAWGIEVFGRVSFSLSIVSFFTAFVAQASMVLFPALRQGTESEQRSFYRGIRDVMEIAFPLLYLCYFPMVWVLAKWLPQYASSMTYFAFLLPVCVFDTKMDICGTTYFKVLRKERLLLLINITACLCSAVVSFIGIYLFKSVEAVLIGVVICIITRSVCSEAYLNRCLGAPSVAIPLEEIILTAFFVLAATQIPGPSAAFLYALFYAVYIFINRKDVFRLARHFNYLLFQNNRRNR